MRVGCTAVLLLLLILAVAIVGGAGALFFAGSVFRAPAVPRADYTADDGHRAQRKILTLVAQDGKPRASRAPVVLTERELNAFLARHLEESAGIPFSPLVIKLLPGTVKVWGRTSLRNLVQGFPLSLLADYFPAGALDRRVWVTATGIVEVSEAETRSGRLRVTEFGVGRQDLGPWVLTLLLGRTKRTLLRWRLPAAVDRIIIERGRVVITTRN